MSLNAVKYLQPKTILDIGANVGGFYNEAREVWPDALFHLIEGNEACLPYLAALSPAAPFQIAYLGEKNEQRQFFKRKGGGTDTGNSFYRELTDFFADDQIETLDVQVHRLDTLLPGFSFDFIKLDVQGAELDILRGGPNLLAKAMAVQLEVAFEAYNQGAPLSDEVEFFMHDNGFTVREEVGQICHPIKRHIVQKDIVFSR